MNGIVSLTMLKDLDKFIRVRLTKDIGGPPIPKSFFYSHWKDGGLGIPNIKERALMLQLGSYINLTMGSDDISKSLHFFAQRECESRKIKQDEDSNFMKICVEDGKIQQETNRKTSSAFINCIHAAIKLNIPINIENGSVFIKEGEDWTLISNNKKFLAYIRKKNREKHKSNIQAMTLKGNPFITLENNHISNFFIGQATAPTCDAFIKFAIRSRTGTLATRQTIAMGNKCRSSNKCPCCDGNLVETQAHILNGCKPRSNKYTTRHNYIVEEIAGAILKTDNNINLMRSRCIISQNDVNDEHEKMIARRKPDLWFIKNNIYHIIEVTVPYDQISDRNPASSPENTLITRRNEKLNKYNELADLVWRTTNTKSEVYVIIVSSVGGLPIKSLHDLNKLLKGNEKLVNLTAKRIVIDAIKGSYLIYRGAELKLMYDLAPKPGIIEDTSNCIPQYEDSFIEESLEILDETNQLNSLTNDQDVNEELLIATTISENLTDSPSDENDDIEVPDMLNTSQPIVDRSVQSRFRRGRGGRLRGRTSGR